MTIPYALIISSASRPHCLAPTLRSLVRFLDQPPVAVIIHDDAVVPDQWAAIKAAIRELEVSTWPKSIVVQHADPPRRLGAAIVWLLSYAEAWTKPTYVLYSQDDHVAVRPVPVSRALAVMEHYQLHHIRFNKRATLDVKETWAGPWKKEEREFSADPAISRQLRVNHLFLDADPARLPDWHCGSAGCDGHGQRVTLTVSDHWYFQLGLWRVSELHRALDFWRESSARWLRFIAQDPEEAINHFFDHVAYGGDTMNPRVRAVCHKTFIWGGIGEDRYIRHIGGAREDWRGSHRRAGQVDDPETAWREILSYPNTAGLR